MGNFDVDVFMGKILKLIIKIHLAFSLVDTQEFQDLLDYLKKDVNIHSRRTVMRRLDERYDAMKRESKAKLNSFKSKFSMTCDVWTSKYQLTFFGFTIHYIDDNCNLQQILLAFKYSDGEHDGESLSQAFIEVLEDYEISERLLRVTADNASNNFTMMAFLENYYNEKYPEAGWGSLQSHCI